MKLNKKNPKILHLTWLTMWLNMHINLEHDVFNKSSSLNYAHYFLIWLFYWIKFFLILHINLEHKF
jgi:hypothetical protein